MRYVLAGLAVAFGVVALVALVTIVRGMERSRSSSVRFCRACGTGYLSRRARLCRCGGILR